MLFKCANEKCLFNFIIVLDQTYLFSSTYLYQKHTFLWKCLKNHKYVPNTFKNCINSIVFISTSLKNQIKNKVQALLWSIFFSKFLHFLASWKSSCPKAFTPEIYLQPLFRFTPRTFQSIKSIPHGLHKTISENNKRYPPPQAPWSLHKPSNKQLKAEKHSKHNPD